MIFMLGDPILKFESQLYFYYILFIFIYTVKNYKYQILFRKYLKKFTLNYYLFTRTIVLFLLDLFI